MNIRLLRLELKDFQGGNFVLEADGKDADVSGANAVGKTRLASAFSWLLFSKDSLGRSDFEIKSLDGTGAQEHGVDHIVEGTLDVDGSPVVLKKVYRELWTKKRGSAERILTGNTVDHFVDGVPVQQKEYTAKVAELAGDEGVFRLLTSPTAFPALHWTKQRALLMEVCGDITDQQVIESDQSLAELPGILGTRTIEDCRKIIASRRTEINKALEGLPIRIDEVKRGLPDVAGLDRKAISNYIGGLETDLNDAKLRLQGIDTGGAIAGLTKDLAIVNADIGKMERVYYLGKVKILDELRGKIDRVKDEKKRAEVSANFLKAEISSREEKIEAIRKILVAARDTWYAVAADRFKDTTEDTCPACGQSLPSDRVEAARNAAKAQFEKDTQRRLDEINARGVALKADIARYEGEIEKFKATEIPQNTFDADLVALGDQMYVTEKFSEDYSGIEGRAELVLMRESIEAKIKDEKEGKAGDREAISGEVVTLTNRLAEAKADAQKFIDREKGGARIEELKAQEKTLAAEFERLEKELYLTEQFVRMKVRLLTEKINEKFKIVSFRLFNTLVNGGIEETCVLTVEGVPYDSGLNSAARTQGGCDIIRTLQNHYGLSCPIWLDNRESVTEIPKMDCQIISLYVSPEDKVLRVEIPKQRRQMELAI